MPTRDAYAVAGLTLLLFFVAYNLQAGWVYAVDALLAGVLLAGFASARAAVRGLAIQRTMPAEVFEGEPVRIPLTVQAQGLLRRRFLLEIHDAVPGLGPRSIFIPFLSRDGRASVSYVSTAVRRGIHEATTVRVSSRGFAGFFHAARVLPAPGRLTVFPRYWKVAHLSLAGVSVASESAGHIRRRGGLEFYGLRDYRQGDSLRQVHWRSSARRGSLVVREFEQEIPGAVNVLLDTRPPLHGGPGTAGAFEDLVRVAASVAWFVSSRGGTMRLFTSQGSAPQEIQGGWGQMLQALAGIESAGGLSPAEVYGRTTGPVASLIVLTSDADAVVELAGHDLGVSAVIADRSSYETEAGEGPTGNGAALMLRALGIPVCVLHKGDDIGACLEGHENDRLVEGDRSW